MPANENCASVLFGGKTKSTVLVLACAFISTTLGSSAELIAFGRNVTERWPVIESGLGLGLVSCMLRLACSVAFNICGIEYTTVRGGGTTENTRGLLTPPAVITCT